ncbi:MAG: hypothetical protein J5526_09255 [Bacteroidales bacterium]|nr:hypothetical protein [Bacteroidales bacterium]
MKEKTDKLITIICLCLAIIGSVFAILFAMNGSSAFFDTAFWMLIAFIAISGCAILGFLVLRIIKGKGWKFLIGIGVLLALVLVAFLISKGNDVSPIFLEKNKATLGTSKLVGTACITTYVMFALSVLAIIYVEVAKFFKK